MKLARFELVADPGVARSGIFVDQRLYETDGESAVGIHEGTAIRLLAPIGHPPAVRLMSPRGDSGAPTGWTYEFLNASHVFGPNRAVDVTLAEGPVDLEVRVAGVVKDSGVAIDAYEAPEFILGYAILVTLVDRGAIDLAGVQRESEAPARDLGSWLGPYLVTPEDLADYRISREATRFQLSVSVMVNDEVAWSLDFDGGASFAELLDAASRPGGVSAGELVAWPAVKGPELEASALGRGLLPGDVISVSVGPLGTLYGSIA